MSRTVLEHLPRRQSRVALYCGVPGAGKTTLAVRHGILDSLMTGYPLVILDSEGTHPCDQAKPMASLRELISSAFGGEGLYSYIPTEEEEIDHFFEAVRIGGRVVVVVDEVSYWANAHRTPKSLARVLRTHRHCNALIHATTQYPGDVSPLVWHSKTDVFIFRTEAKRAVERVVEECALEPEEIKTLKQGEFLAWHQELK